MLSSPAELDETLVVLIRVLDRMKLKTNVGAWVREGELWARFGKPEDVLFPIRLMRTDGSTVFERVSVLSPKTLLTD